METHQQTQHMIEPNAATSIADIMDGYFAMWNESDPIRRQAVIARTWTQDARYADPLVAADRTDALDAMVAGVQTQFPGHRFVLASAIDAHHGWAMWQWELAGAGAASGAPVAAGVDFATLAPDGRLREVIGFLTAQPDAARSA
jgi:SnoaL-like domain